MDRALVEGHLRQARQHVKQGTESIRRQREVVAELERDGHDTARAKELLRTFEDIQAMHVADRDRLTKELAALRAK